MPNQTCIMESAAEQARKERGLPPNAPIAMALVCPCPKCSPRC